MAKYVELRRHTDADGDTLTAEGVQAALELGSRLHGGYDVAVSSGAQRATQTLACLLAGLGERVPRGVVVEPGLRSGVEDRWRAAYEQAGSGALEALRDADAELVEADSAALGAALRRVLDSLPDGGRALLVGHSPTNEGDGVLVVEDDGELRVESL
jgi:broad specificity phosphatase PhoE